MGRALRTHPEVNALADREGKQRVKRPPALRAFSPETVLDSFQDGPHPHSVHALADSEGKLRVYRPPCATHASLTALKPPSTILPQKHGKT